MSPDLLRMLRPSSIAVVGGGAWCIQIIRQSRQMGYSGRIDVVHPNKAEIEGVRAVPTLGELPQVPDAVFIGVNRHATIAVVAELSKMGAGGAICFASGFSEAVAEDQTSGDLQTRLVEAAGEMPVLGPNCYGFINALDGALLWPDQHGCSQVERGVAILTQSSNIAINLTMQQRGLPIAYMVTCGNMAQIRQAELASAQLDDPRVTAIGLHIEGFSHLPAWHELALKAYAKNVPLVALKVGKSEQAQQATVSHTASLAGEDAGADALLERLGISRAPDLPSFLETLKLFHCNGRLASNALASVSCSGGEAGLAADTAHGRRVHFPPLTPDQSEALAGVLGPMVALANPLDYHTYIWRDAEKMAAVWTAMAADHIGMTLLIVDYPHTDPGDWNCATEAALAVRARTGRPVAVVATLPELMPQQVIEELIAGGVTPLCGLTDAIIAAELASESGIPNPQPPLLPGADREGVLMAEADAKQALSSVGMRVPVGIAVKTPSEAAREAQNLRAPLVLKGIGFAHKSEHGAVRLGLQPEMVAQEAQRMAADAYLVEEMVQGAVVELLVGVTRDAAHGFLLTLGAGGVLTELWQDTVSMLLPVTAKEVEIALGRLRIARLLEGYRGRPAADQAAIVEAVLALQSYVIAHQATISEVEINPLICTQDAAIAADALIRKV